MVFAAKKTIVKVNEFGCLHDLTPSAWLILENKKRSGLSCCPLLIGNE
jgi:hypothetical protein